MVNLEEHPIVKRILERSSGAERAGEVGPLDGDWLRRLCLDAGADDVGFVEAAGLQPLCGMQVVCRCLPDWRNRSRWLFQFFRLLHPQLSGIYERVHGLG